ncbi:MAG: pentose kinase [Hyphomicrobiales bacterium]|nr:pentose kinase [Hyphomicrobiales bacterium]
MTAPSYLSIDVGTGSARAAVVDGDGRIRHIVSQEHEQIVPAHGWSEQRVDEWWDGVVHVVRDAVDWADRNDHTLEAVAACGQMHATVLVDDDGRPTRPTAPLWNDKRTDGHVRAFEASHDASAFLARTANPPTSAWPGFKLQWIRDNDEQAYARASAVLMPKDYINLRLTGVRSMDWTEAALSYLMDPQTGDWSDDMIAALGLDRSKLAPIRMPSEVVGTVTREAAKATGLRAGTPVLVGGGDYPVALLGSGVNRPGLASEVAGTSSIITLLAASPILDQEISNVGTPEGNWGAFVLLESGGDAVRWARRVLNDSGEGYEDALATAAQSPAGSDGLFFLPYLTGERFGEHRNSRAQFFGLSAGHGPHHLHRAVLEGVAFAVNRHLRIMEKATGVALERVIASGGGAKADLWLTIKASAYGLSILIPEEAECGVVGCAALAAYATGRFNTLDDAVKRFVRFSREVAPDPKWVERYRNMRPIFDSLYRGAQAHYDDLDRLAGDPHRPADQENADVS